MDIYGLEVAVEIPTTGRSRVSTRTTISIYRTEEEKWEAIIVEIEDCHEARPAGAGRYGVHREERSAVSRHAQGEAWDQARRCSTRAHHEQEAKIIAEAGVPVR